MSFPVDSHLSSTPHNTHFSSFHLKLTYLLCEHGIRICSKFSSAIWSSLHIFVEFSQVNLLRIYSFCIYLEACISKAEGCLIFFFILRKSKLRFKKTPHHCKSGLKSLFLSPVALYVCAIHGIPSVIWAWGIMRFWVKDLSFFFLWTRICRLRGRGDLAYLFVSRDFWLIDIVGQFSASTKFRDCSRRSKMKGGVMGL